ncbi:hypothetical protein E2C01_044629 [Portunus trituberculatus]|uniref:Uncharacterized protein n=1 Tax=Portunus trituberculatus TaxID=210409 RepID=A0A5B7FZR0_PORTR|nr:hypothetical protein [Portunus trituberculatus]
MSREKERRIKKENPETPSKKRLDERERQHGLKQENTNIGHESSVYHRQDKTTKANTGTNTHARPGTRRKHQLLPDVRRVREAREFSYL